MPLPSGTTNFPPSNAAPKRSWFRVYAFIKGSGGPRTIRGPYMCDVVPVNGDLQIPGSNPGELVQVENRVYFPLTANVAARTIVGDVATNMQYDVIYTQRWRSKIEAWVKRAMPDA